MIAIARTDTGRVRQSNEDAWLILEGRFPLFAVADGMGGHRGGNVASLMAVESLRQLDTRNIPDEAQLKAAVIRANEQIYQRQLHDLSLSGMGTTLTCLWEGEDHVLIAHVGDSRCYRLRQQALEQLTLDHSLVGELVRSGTLTPESALSYPYRNIVTRAVGTEAGLLCDLMRMEKLPGDRYLICSDGLTEYAGVSQLIFAMQQPLETGADILLQTALEGGGRDNITLLLLEVTG